MAKVGVILSGCGVFDGGEIHESVCALLHLNRLGAEVQCLAPNIDQMHVINHVAGAPAEGESRNVLTESARIARGEIADLATVKGTDFDAIVVPGGFGAAKNLCTFATEGANCTVNDDVRRVLTEAQGAGKPIGLMCIAPAIAAAVFGKTLAPKLTIGTDAGTAAGLEALGAKHVECPVDEAVIDEKNRIVTTPAYMMAQNIGEVYAGAGKFVEAVLGLV